MDEKELYILHADFCKFMANPKRIEILFLLGERELCVEEITEFCYGYNEISIK